MSIVIDIASADLNMSINTPAVWQIPPSNSIGDRFVALQQSLSERLAQISCSHQLVRFASSMAAEDMVLVDAIATLALPIEIFTLNTGRLHRETLNMVATSERRYGISIKQVEPTQSDIDAFVSHYGLNGFYDSELAKKACCRARKIIPLDHALTGAQAWLTGQRREQAVTRVELSFIEADESHEMTKYNPLFDWSESDVWTYLQSREVPIHPLHFQGYPSIGCEPCTRAVRVGEDIRAGRWWWLQQENKECGLHVK